jgi:HAD superfamily hydrolase (TIGR01662 family)
VSPLKLVIFDLDDTLCDTSGNFESTDGKVEELALFPAVEDLLIELRSQDVQAAIVSTGERTLQERKVAILGLRALVDAVYFCDAPEGKLGLFKQCFQDFHVSPRQTLVVGDRIDREITYGKMLGCTTVRLRQGRHQVMTPEAEAQMPDYTLQNIAALRTWIALWRLEPGEDARR